MEEETREIFIETLKTIYTGRNILIYLLVINLVNFTLMWYDKNEAKEHKWRIQEKTFFIISLLGGSIGGLIGMYTFRHKTKKWYFKYGFLAILICQILLAVYIFIKSKA